jgi:hypothetical protein
LLSFAHPAIEKSIGIVAVNVQDFI